MYSYLKCIVLWQVFKTPQAFWITLYSERKIVAVREGG